jgi:hypothetical protein
MFFLEHPPWSNSSFGSPIRTDASQWHVSNVVDCSTTLDASCHDKEFETMLHLLATDLA